MMLRTLLESARPHSIPLGSLAASVAVHVALSVPAWTGTPEAELLAKPESFITRALFLPPPDRVPSRAAGAERLQWLAIGGRGGLGVFIPDAVRPTTLGGALLDRAAAVPRDRDGDLPGDLAVAGADSVYSILQVDELVERYPDSAAPIYPSDLLQQALEGLVRVRYVVDATGHVDTATIHVLRSTHSGFTTAVIESLARMRFRPASLAGKPVSQVVEQDFGFHIERQASAAPAALGSDTTQSLLRRH